jgi:hypothetical protein
MESDQVDTFGMRVNKDVAFTTHKNQPHKGAMSRQLNILRKFAPILKQFLKPDEEILLAVNACSPMSFLEQLTSGWMIYYLKRCVLIITNKRILHFPTRMNFAPKASIAQILYGDIAEAKASGFLGRVLKLKYRTGKKEHFNYIQASEFKKLKATLPSLPKESQPSEAGERHHLCPRCQARLLKERFACPNCHLKFKDGERALRLSLLYPGGGYFYTKHPFLGIGDAFVEGALLIVVILALFNLLTGAGGADEWISLIVFGGILAVEKAVTIYHAKHYVNEYIPLDDNFVPATVGS